MFIGDDATQIAFDAVIAVDHLADADDFVVGQLMHPAFGRDADLGADLPGLGAADPMDIGQRDSGRASAWEY